MKNVTIIEMSELQEGIEGYPVCIVDTDNITEIMKIIDGKGLGVQGTEDGVRCWIQSEESAKQWHYPYVLLFLDIETFRNGIEKKLITWHNVIEWQRWGMGSIFQDKKIIRIKKDVQERISPLWVITDYQIICE
jgi:hypothetical protein